MVAIDFGITIRPTPHGGTLPEMIRANERMLQSAAGDNLTCWVIDHFQFDADPIFECLAFLAYNAGQHPGLRWGTLVLGQSYRNPALTAKIAATLQFLTGGRFILGLGAGDAEVEHHAYGYPFPQARVRVAQLDEAASIIRALWRGDPAKLVRRRSMGHRGDVHVISGKPDEVTERIAEFAAVGVRHMQLNFLDFPRTDSLELFLSDVSPRFSHVGT